MFLVLLDPWDWTPHTLDVLIALGTTGAVFVALAIALGRGFREWRHRPELVLLHDPDTDVRIELAEPMPGSTLPIPYMRLGVYNRRGRRAAEDVEVIVEEVRAIEPRKLLGSDTWCGNGWTVRNFGPLAWTHVKPPALRIGPGVMRTVDLGRVLASNAYASGRFILGLQSEPRSEVHLLLPGVFELTLVAAGSNTDARHYRLTLLFDPWEGRELHESLKIVEGPNVIDPPRLEPSRWRPAVTALREGAISTTRSLRERGRF